MLKYESALMITIYNRQRKILINTKHIQQTAQQMLNCIGYGDFDLGILFTTDATIKKYNATYRKKNNPTDILSFPYHPNLKPGQKINIITPDDKNLGDIIISLPYAQREAEKTWQRSFEKHLIALLAHGIAHLCGYNHETEQDFNMMQHFEKKLLRVSLFQCQ
jgi:probable rRNA maturation factor